MDSAEERYMAEENTHVWGRKSNCLVFDKKILDDQKEDALLACKKSLEKEKIKNKKLEQTLARSKKRFDLEYKILTDQNRKLSEVNNTSSCATDKDNSRY